MKKALLAVFIISACCSFISPGHGIAEPKFNVKEKDYQYGPDPCGNILTVHVECAPASACSETGNMQQAADDYRTSHTNANGCYF